MERRKKEKHRVKEPKKRKRHGKKEKQRVKEQKKRKRHGTEREKKGKRTEKEKETLKGKRKGKTERMKK